MSKMKYNKLVQSDEMEYWPIIYVTRPQHDTSCVDKDISFEGLQSIFIDQLYYIPPYPRNAQDMQYKNLPEIVYPLPVDTLKNCKKECQRVIDLILKYTMCTINDTYQDNRNTRPYTIQEYFNMWTNTPVGPFDVIIGLYTNGYTRYGHEYFIKQKTWKLSDNVAKLSKKSEIKIKFDN